MGQPFYLTINSDKINAKAALSWQRASVVSFKEKFLMKPPIPETLFTKKIKLPDWIGD